MTKMTIELPEQLAEELNAYLRDNPDDTITAMIKEALRIRQFPTDGAKILELAGFVKEASRDAAEHAEDFVS